MAMREWRRAVYHTAPNSNGTLFQIAAANTFYTIATLTLPAGSYFITSKVTVSNFDWCANLTGGSLSGTYAQVDLEPDNGTVGIWLATLPLEAVATFSGTTAVSLQCEAAPNPDVYIYYPQMSAIPVTNIVNQ